MGSRLALSEGLETCIICAEPVRLAAVAPCNNVTCHVCCFRQRALYQRKTCLVCRTEHDAVAITDRHGAKYADVAVGQPAKHGIYYSLKSVRAETLLLLEARCTVCSELCKNVLQLSEHLRTVHSRLLCTICTEHKNVFVCELKVYTQKELQRHINEGDAEGFSGHPKCRFDRHRFYSEDELNVHIRDKHERCFICDQHSPKAAGYFRDYDDLYAHFAQEHYVCTVAACVEKRFVVFRDDLDLLVHMLKEHGGIAGQNGRLVLGASLGFSGQLSKQFVENEQDLDTKRRRLEARARHHLGGKAGSLREFNATNSAYRNGKLPVQGLMAKYKELFPECSPDEIGLLVYDLAETLPALLLKTQLLGIANVAEQKFPALGGLLHNVIAGSWSKHQVPKKEMFPALAKRLSSPQVKQQPVRYVKQPAPKPQVKVMRVKPFQPTYLDRPASAPVSAQASASNSRSQLPVTRPSLTRDLTKFPALPTKKPTRAPLARKTPLALWNQPMGGPAPKKDEWDIPIIDKRLRKKN